MTKRYFVTGGTIGNQIVAQLCELAPGADIRVAVRKPRPNAAWDAASVQQVPVDMADVNRAHSTKHSLTDL